MGMRPDLETYRIRQWTKWFEKSHKPTERAFAWVAVPTRHDGKGFRRLLRRPDGMALFGAFVLMLEVAAKMPTRGELSDEDGPLDARDLADATGGDQAVFELAIRVLTDESEKICWLEVVKCRDKSRQVPPTGQDSTGQDRTEIAQAALACAPEASPKRDKPAPKCAGALKSAMPEEPHGFSEFWKEWPKHERKRGKSKCLRLWIREELEPIKANVLGALSRCKASRDWGEGYVPLPMTWLTDTPWETDPGDAVTPDPQQSHFRDPTTAELELTFGPARKGSA